MHWQKVTVHNVVQRLPRLRYAICSEIFRNERVNIKIEH